MRLSTVVAESLLMHLFVFYPAWKVNLGHEQHISSCFSCAALVPVVNFIDNNNKDETLCEANKNILSHFQNEVIM